MTARKKPAQETQRLEEFSHDAMNAAANAAVGFGFIKTIIESVGKLTESDPALARRLAEAGRYWAHSLEGEVLDFQHRIESMWEGMA